MKKKVLTIMMVLYSALLLAQSKGLSPDEIAGHVSDGLLTSYHPDSAILAKTCRRGFLLIKFKVNVQGRIINVAFSKDSSAFITAALKVAVNSLQNDTALINTLKASGKTIIQPFLYFYQAGCNFPRANVASVTVTDKESAEFNRTYLMTLMEMDHIDDAVSDILTFDGKPTHAIDALLLNPMMVSSGSME